MRHKGHIVLDQKNPDAAPAEIPDDVGEDTEFWFRNTLCFLAHGVNACPGKALADDGR